jgi:hypothetical protein
MAKRRSKDYVLHAAQAYVDELLRAYPSLVVDIRLEAYDDFDAWIQVELPPELAESDVEVERRTAELNYDFWEQTGVNIIATVADRQPVS